MVSSRKLKISFSSTPAAARDCSGMSGILAEPPAHRVIGIIGGMGPEATGELMRRASARTPACGDEDHIHVIVESNPKIPSRMAHLIERTGPDPTPELIRIARNLQ